MSARFPLATSTWDRAEHDAMQRVIASDRYTMGPEVAAFERRFADYFGTKFAVMVNSGSSANLIMAAALTYTTNPDLKLNPGDEVIVPAVSWSTTYYPLHQYGLKMVFVDIDPDTLNYDLDALADAVTERTRALMVVNLLGNPNDFDAIAKITEGRGIVMIEDNCESMGATLGGKHCGTFGVMGSFSTFFSHHISTMEGGVVVTDDEELYHVMLSLRAHGWTRNLPDKNHVTGTKSADPFDESFRFVLPGYNLRPLEMSGALGIEQVAKLDGLIAGRRRNGTAFVEAMQDHETFRIQREVGNSSWFGFSLILRPEVAQSRADVVRALEATGFECRPIVAGNFARKEIMKYFNYEIHGDLPHADYLDTRGLFVGNHHYPVDEAIEALDNFKIC